MSAFLKMIAWGWGRESRSSRVLGIAAIHATVLTILIGIISAYFIFAQDKIHEMEMQAIREAEKINQIQFVWSYYWPSQDFCTKYNNPENIEETIKMVIFLYSLLSERNTHPGMEIPKRPADRAEKALQIMNLLVHRYPFPEAVSSRSGSISFFPANPLLFKDKVEIAKWSGDLERLLGSMKLFIYMRQVFIGEKMNEYFQALYSQTKELRAKWKTDLSLQVMGYIDPYFVFNDYILNLQKANESKSFS